MYTTEAAYYLKLPRILLRDPVNMSQFFFLISVPVKFGYVVLIPQHSYIPWQYCLGTGLLHKPSSWDVF